MTFKQIQITVASILTTAFLIYITIWYTYTQQYVQDSPNTATKGVFFKNTIHLEEYKNIANGNSWLGKYDRYSRSDRMTEQDVLTVYCKDYCKD